jgi:hypothetical protein
VVSKVFTRIYLYLHLIFILRRFSQLLSRSEAFQLSGLLRSEEEDLANKADNLTVDVLWKCIYQNLLPALYHIIGKSKTKELPVRSFGIMESILCNPLIQPSPYDLLSCVQSSTTECSELIKTVIHKRYNDKLGCALSDLCAGIIHHQWSLTRGIDFEDNSMWIKFAEFVDMKSNGKAIFSYIYSNLLSTEHHFYSSDDCIIVNSFPFLYAASFGATLFPSNVLKFCDVFVRYLPTIVCNIQNRGKFHERTSCFHLSIWLRLIKVSIDCNVTFSADYLDECKRHVFPDMLNNTIVVTSAVAFALSLPHGMDILINCIGVFQDEALSDTCFSSAKAVDYVELIEIVIHENVRLIKYNFYFFFSVFI